MALGTFAINWHILLHVSGWLFKVMCIHLTLAFPTFNNRK